MSSRSKVDSGRARKFHCRGCGKTTHGDGKKMYRRDCPAFGKKCLNCGMHDHFKEVCEQRNKVAFMKSQLDDTETDEYDTMSDEMDDEEQEVTSNFASETLDFREARGNHSLQ